MFVKTAQAAIVGAGPAGLTLACLLQLQGCRTTVIEARSEGSTASRATGLRNGTLKLLEQLGAQDAIMAHGCSLAGMQIYRDGVPTTFHGFAGSAARPADNLSVPQPALEQELKARALELGVEILEGTELIDLSQNAADVRLMCRRNREVLALEAPWAIGADGTRSTVRRLLGIGYEGDIDSDHSFVVDCELDPAPDPTLMHYHVSGPHRLAIIPLDRDGRRFKLSGSLSEDLRDAALLTEIEERAAALTKGPVRIRTIGPATRYRVSRRIASAFSMGRCFLIGDAAHSCPPNGGWGLNTALADAANLAWKLAGVIKGHLGTSLLESYGTERRAAAAALIAFTDGQRRVAFSQDQNEVRRAKEAEHLTQIECDNDLIVAAQTTPVWEGVAPGRNLWELAARRPGLGDIPAAGPGEFILLVGDTADGALHKQDLLAQMSAAGLAAQAVLVPPDRKGSGCTALVRPDGIVALVDSLDGDTLRQWIGRRDTSSEALGIRP
jgi:2-polyprenyl-6-methoxyphenol hydroxylase-like FAD-dependent oxidoreductase